MGRELPGRLYFDLTYFAEESASGGAAVADPPASASTAAAEATGEAGKGTAAEGASAEASTDAKGEGEGSDPDNSEGSTPPSPVDEAVAAKLTAELSRIASDEGLEGEFHSYDELKAARETKSLERREEAVDQQSRISYSDRAQELLNTLTSIEIEAHDEEGNPITVRMTEDQAKTAFAPLQGLRSDIRAIENAENLDVLADFALSAIPEEMHDAFEKAVDNGGKGLALGPWMSQVLEHAAPHTKWAQGREKEHAAALKAEYAKGFEDRKAAPNGQPSQKGTNGAPGLTREAFMNMTPGQRADAWKANPEAVRAL